MQEDTQTVLSEVWQGGIAIAYFTKQVTLDEFKAMYPKGANMDKERIKQMAEEAGFDDYEQDEMLARFAQLVAQDCANAAFDVHRELRPELSSDDHLTQYEASLQSDAAKKCVANIRARYGIKE